MPLPGRTLLSLATLTTLLLAQDPIDGAAALETVKTLTSPEFKGRKSGLEGGMHAEQWMAARVREAGLDPLGDAGHFNMFRASVTAAGSKPVFAFGEKAKATYLADYVTLLYSGAAKVEAPVVLAGWGIHAPDKGYSDYEGLDVKGKIVLAVRGKPADARFDEERYIGYKSSTAFARGAAGFILVEGKTAVPGTIQEKYYRAELPAIWAAGAFVDRMLAQAKAPDLAEIKKRLAAGERMSMPLEGVRANLDISARLLKDRPMRNVVGVWKSNGETDEWVVVGAHLDHVGIDATGNLYPGADDNASGSSMLLEVARAVAKRGKHYRRNILFIWFAGEEQGLLGSWAFVRKPPVPLDKIAIMINTDMVGQGEARLSVGGAGVYPRDAAWLDGLDGGGVPFTRTRSGNRSDHYPFQSSGVPAFSISTSGKHPNYHQPGDVVANIKAELLGAAATYVQRLTVRAAKSTHAHVRPLRREEYIWNRATTVDARSSTSHAAESAGSDLRIEWQDGAWAEMARGLARSHSDGTAKSTSESVLVPGSAPGPLLRAIKPTRLLGVKGRDAARFARAAHKVGALCFAPFAGKTPITDTAELDALQALAREHPIVVDLWGSTPESMPAKAIAKLDAPILLVPIHRWTDAKGVLKLRRRPWFAVYELKPLRENKPSVHAEIARDIRAWMLERGLPANRLLIVPGPSEDETWQAQAPTLLPGLVAALKLDDGEIRRLIGGNFANVVSTTFKPAPKK